MLTLKNALCKLLRKFHTIVILTATVAVMLSGCHASVEGKRTYEEEKQRLIDKRVKRWYEYYEDTDQDVIKEVRTLNGSVVMLALPSDNDMVMCHFANIVYANTQSMVLDRGVGWVLEEYDTKIFYNDEWDVCTSTMSKIQTDTGTDVIILITPNYREFYDKIYGVEVSYKDSVEYGLSPYDTRNSDFTPIYATPDNPDDDQIDGPMWMLVLSFEDLEEDYELHYGEFVLTYEDIKNGTWEP